VRLSFRGVTLAGCGVPGIRSCKHTCPAASSRHLAALAKPLAKANAARTSLSSAIIRLAHHPSHAYPARASTGPRITRPASAKARASAVVKGYGAVRSLSPTFCVATGCRAFLSSGATTCRRGAGDLFEASGDNVNLLLPGFESPVPPNCRARRPAAGAPPRNINNVDIG
jgi:hypothetical protein